MTDAEAEFLKLAAEIRSLPVLNLGEGDTRAHFIDPVLALLGYRTITDIRREVAIPATKEFLDYELCPDGQPLAIVEAKALKNAITDQHAAQCVQYASVLGIRWCFITNGIAWALYDAYAKGPLAAKKVIEVRLDGDSEGTLEAWSVLSLFSRDSLAQSAPVTQLLVDRVVADELSRPDSPAVTALRKAVKGRFGERVLGRTVLEAIGRFASRISEALVTVHEGLGTQVDVGVTSGKRQRQTMASSISQLVEAGLLPADATLECRLYGATHTARISGGRIEMSGRFYDSPSAAASALRAGKASNGWRIWCYQGSTLRDLRARLQRSQSQLPNESSHPSPQ